jgi:hypothetical protein
MKTRLKNEGNTELWQISCASVICTKKATRAENEHQNKILPGILL